MVHVLRSAQEAWERFREIGGIEPKHRDRDFVEDLRVRLDPDAEMLEEALGSVTTDRLVLAMFETIAPFSSMFSDILGFFRRAGAAEGRQNWVLSIDEVPFDLREFERFVETSRSSPTVADLPAIDTNQAFQLWNLFRRDMSGRPAAAPAPDVREWLAAWEAGAYRSFPRSIEPARVPEPLRDSAAIAQAALAILRPVARTREEAHRLRSEMGWWAGEIYHPAAVASVENDHWLRHMIVTLGNAVQLPPAELEALGNELAGFLAAVPRRPVMLAADSGLLERVLSLPAWRQRHELYAVWIAAEIVSSLPEHDIEIHARDGVLEFAFRETLLATIGGRSGNVLLYSERKAGITDPRGKGRKDNVQPDYGIWAGSRCRLVIEVKHYKRAATRRFSEVLADYATAHPDAEVVLVNYGPTADMLDRLDNVPYGVRTRCRHIAHLTPMNAAARADFRKLVADAAGPPPPRGTLVLDVSGSMGGVFRGTYGNSVIASWLRSDDVAGIAEVALVDDRLRWRGSIEDAREEVRTWTPDGGTALVPVLRELLEAEDEVLVASDWDGLAEIEGERDLEVHRTAQRAGFNVARVRLRGSRR